MSGYDQLVNIDIYFELILSWQAVDQNLMLVKSNAWCHFLEHSKYNIVQIYVAWGEKIIMMKTSLLSLDCFKTKVFDTL